MLDGRFKSVTFLGDNMDEHRSLKTLCLGNRGSECIYIMSVDGSEIYDSHLLKHHSRRNHKRLKTVLGSSDPVYNRITVRLIFDFLINAFLQSEISGGCSDRVKILRNSSYILGYGHVVVVEDDYKIRIKSSGIIECFISHSAGKRSITDNGYDGLISASHIARTDHAESRGYGS